MKTTYKSKGFVYGYLWGGGEGSYAAKKLTADTERTLLKKAVKGLDGSLDGGMGFESLIGAILYIEKVTTTVIDGKEFTHSDFDTKLIGNLTENQQNHLLEQL